MGALVAVVLLVVGITAGVIGFLEWLAQGICENDCHDTSRPELLLALGAMSLLASISTGMSWWRKQRKGDD